MKSPLRRFLHLERARPDAPPSAGPDARRRFGALEAPRDLPAAGTALPGSATDRFRAPEEGALALALAPEGEQPFVRCAACETDHARHAERCSRCGAALDSPEQRAFNERLWAARSREAEAERQASEERREARIQQGEEDARARRALAEAMAEEILRREREGEPWLERAARWVRGRFSR